MRPFRLAPALLSLLVLNASFASRASAQPAPEAPEEEGADAEEAPVDDAPQAPSAPPPAGSPPSGSAPAAPPADLDPEAEGEPAAEEEMPSDAEMEAEMAKELASQEAAGAQALSKPPTKGKGAIVGVVSDAIEHETTPEAQITVVGTKYKTLADFDGRYRLELPPGTYTLRIYVELHKPSVIKGVEVKADTLERFDIDVVPDEASVDTVEITTDVDHSSVEGLLLTRQRSASVGDGVGRAEISRTPASNAAQATQRVVGATIVGNRFVYVRGLGERYTNSLLNGAPLPSPEPDRAAIPLDLFPSLILENITIVKTFTPDMPGDFAGGSVRIDTRELPTKPLFQLSIGTGVDSKATLRDRFTQPSSGTDWLGYDHSVRPLPKGFPDYFLKLDGVKPGHDVAECKTDPSFCTSADEMTAAGRQLNSSMHPRRALTPPNYSLAAVAGNGWSLPGEQRLGVLATLNYGRSYRNRSAIRRDFQPDVEPGTGRPIISLENDIQSQQGEDKVNWGALGSVSYWPSLRHRITLTGLHTQLADSTTNFSTGTYENLNGTVKSAQLRYVSRALNLLQLRGEHDFPALNKATLTWNASYSVAGRSEPDTRTTAYELNEVTQSWSAATNGSSGVHQFSDQSERQRGGGLDWTQPLTRDADTAKIKLGGLLSVRDRDFQARRFVFKKQRGASAGLFECGADYSLDCPDKLFQYGNIGSQITLNETTFPEDAYHAELNIYAGYALLDLNVSKGLRLVGGARIEHTDQRIDPARDRGDADKTVASASIVQTDVLPALSLTYAVNPKTKLRVAVSETLARPQIRELSPSTYADYFGGRELSGNTQLRLTRIKNADLRLETFPSAREVLAFSFFYKLFDSPIEPFVTSNTIVSFQNAKAARLVGLELEARKSLEFVTKALADLSVIANLTLAYSQIELDTEQGKLGFIATNLDRAMVNQAPYVVNLALDYANDPLALNMRLLGNVVGPRIVQVGTSGLDDQYEQPKLSLDATASKGLGKHISLRLTGTNLLNSAWVTTLGKKRDRSRETYRESEGQVVTLTGTYTY